MNLVFEYKRHNMKEDIDHCDNGNNNLSECRFLKIKNFLL